MPAEEYICDPMAVRDETVSLINNGRLEIPREVILNFGGEKGQQFCENPHTHQWYSKYGIINTLINIPPLLVEAWWNGNLPYNSPSRVIFLNFLNLALSAAMGFYLCLIASRYTNSPWVIGIFILSAFYCTYWWNYLRAQSSEICQTLFLLGFFYHAISYLNPLTLGADVASRRRLQVHSLLTGIFLGILILTKTIYIILLPSLLAGIIYSGLTLARSNLQMSLGQIFKALFWFTKWMALPILAALFALLAVNAYKFGSPFDTGYEEWGESHKPIFSGNILSGLWLLLFSVQGSILLNFPILIFALFGYRHFFKSYRADAFLVLTNGLVLFLLYAKMLNPLGTWCYGARYMIVLLPLLSLPFIFTLEFLLYNWRRWWAVVCLAGLALTLSYSFKLQLNVNALPFFTYYRMQHVFSFAHDAEIDDYFTSHHFGIINGEILAAKHGQPFPPLVIAEQKFDPQATARLKAVMTKLTYSNYYWWH